MDNVCDSRPSPAGGDYIASHGELLLQAGKEELSARYTPELAGRICNTRKWLEVNLRILRNASKMIGQATDMMQVIAAEAKAIDDARTKAGKTQRPKRTKF